MTDKPRYILYYRLERNEPKDGEGEELAEDRVPVYGPATLSKILVSLSEVMTEDLRNEIRNIFREGLAGAD